MHSVFPYAMPCQVRQLALLEAGCQPWNSDTLASSPDASRFAFAATLAVYVYEKAGADRPHQLVAVMSQHRKTITSLAWHPTDSDLFASASLDPLLVVWNVRKQAPLAQLALPDPMQPRCLAFLPHSHGTLGFLDGSGPLLLWHYSGGGAESSGTSLAAAAVSAGSSATISALMGAAAAAASAPTVHKETQALACQVTVYRWHPGSATHGAAETAGRIALGHEDGTLSIVRPGKKTLRKATFLESDEDFDEEADDAVIGMEWDALATNFLLVDSRCSGLRLIDVDVQTTVAVFQQPSASSAPSPSLAWLPDAPGIFAAGDSASGVLRVYTVSKTAPIETIRLKQAGFRNLRAVRAPLAEAEAEAADTTSSGSGAGATDGSGYSLPDCLLLCTFLDGGVGLFDIRRRDWHFLREMGHVETVFDCQFSPRDENLLATGSFDGTVKIWRIGSGCGGNSGCFSPVQSSPGNEGIVYSIAWNADATKIAGATAKNGVFVYEVATGAIEPRRFDEHGQHPVYCVSWNCKPPHQLASASADCYCVVRSVDVPGAPAKRLAHPAPVFGVAWHQHTRDILATACEDKAVRVYYLSNAGDRPSRLFTGHTSKVFGVRWSPLRESYLCSGSDDGTIRVWDCTGEKSVAHLKGHTGPVRGLAWHPELAYLLLSGSWDCHIHCWDIRDGSCLAAVSDHRADVYGLHVHPRRPMLLASCSRDSTLRLWSLTELAGPLPACLIFRSLTEACFAPAEAVLRQPGLIALSGAQSRRLLREGGEQLPLFLHASPAACDLHDLHRLLTGQAPSSAVLSDSYGRPGGHVAARDLLKFATGRAQRLEAAATASTSRRRRQLHEAASAHLRCGNLRRYCELQADLGRWERALSLAPGVGAEFWRRMCRRYAACQDLELDDLLAFAVATGDAGRAVRLLNGHGKFADALLISQAAREDIYGYRGDGGGGDGQESDEDDEPPPGKPEGAATGNRNLPMTDAWTALADWLFLRGCPVDAACCHLACGQLNSALGKLLRGNELDLALWLAVQAGGTCDRRLQDLAAELSVCRQDRLVGLDLRRRAELAAHLARLHSAEGDLLVRFACRFSAAASDIDALHRLLGLPDRDACLETAERLRGSDGADDRRRQLDIVGHYLISANPLAGLEFGLAAVRATLAERDAPWTLESVEALVALMSCVRTGKLQQASAVQEKNELLFLATYLGALRAIRQGYDSVVAPLFRHARLHYERHKDSMQTFGRHLTGAQLDKELYAWKLMRRCRAEAKLPDDTRAAWRALMHKCGRADATAPQVDATGLELGEDIVSGSALPYHADYETCFFAEKRIRGPVFHLEDGRSTIGHNDACMWAKVNPYSPTMTGARINPF